MASRKEELGTLHSTRLATLCKKVAGISDTTAAKARALTVEWVSLQSRPRSLKEKKANDAKQQDLWRRMLDFLESCDEVDWMPKH